MKKIGANIFLFQHVDFKLFEQISSEVMQEFQISKNKSAIYDASCGGGWPSFEGYSESFDTSYDSADSSSGCGSGCSSCSGGCGGCGGCG